MAICCYFFILIPFFYLPIFAALNSYNRRCTVLVASKNKDMDNTILTTEQLQAMADAIACRVALNTKEVLTFDEACTYTGLSKSAMYKHTMNATVPCYRPTGKLVYFNRQELTNWLLSNRCSTQAELEDKAQHYCRKGVAL